MKTLTIYYVAKENGSFVCGPFTRKEHADNAAEGYSGSWLWGKCHVVEKEVPA